MITTSYVTMMARYNAWQNRQLADIVHLVDEADLYQDQGAFFGSIMATLNHIHWADTLWMSRMTPTVEGPADAPDNWADHIATPAEWAEIRLKFDDQIIAWAAALTQDDLDGSILWRSVMRARDFDHPKSLCIAHMFNHQTHHRGQVHAMLTAKGHEAPVTDILFMPEFC